MALNRQKLNLVSVGGKSASSRITSRIRNDIKASGPVFASDPAYIHNNHLNFLAGSAMFNNEIKSEYGRLKENWNQITQKLIELLKHKVNRFLKELGCTKKEFATEYKKQIGNDNLKLTMDSINAITELQHSTKKTKLQITELYEKIMKIFNKELNAFSKSVSHIELKEGFFNEWSKRAGIFSDAVKNSIINNIKIKDHETNFNVDLRNKNVSVRVWKNFAYSLTEYVVGMAIQATLGELFKKTNNKKLAETLIKISDKNTQVGTTSDIMTASGEYSFSVKTTNLKQTKNKMLGTMFQKSGSSEKSEVPYPELGKTDGTGNSKDMYKISNYIFMNSSFLGLKNSTSIKLLTEYWSLLFLNEKILGYNKKGQKGKTYLDLFEEFPVAVLTTKGEIMWIDDVFSNLKDHLSKQKLQVKKDFNYSIFGDSTNYINEWIKLLDAKQNYLYRKKRKSITYNAISKSINSDLTSLQTKLLKNIKLEFSYNLNDIANKGVK